MADCLSPIRPNSAPVPISQSSDDMEVDLVNRSTEDRLPWGRRARAASKADARR